MAKAGKAKPVTRAMAKAGRTSTRRGRSSPKKRKLPKAEVCRIIHGFAGNLVEVEELVEPTRMATIQLVVRPTQPSVD